MKDLYSKLKQGDKSIVFMLFLCVFMVLFIQHRFVWMYFDDFANASLSYGYKVPGVNGTDFNIGDIFEWSSYIYMNWGGRLLYADLFLLPMMKTGPHLFMGCQALVITLTLYYCYKIVTLYSKKNSLLIITLLMIGYFLIGREFIVNGLYWASASVLYIWPLLPFFMFIYYYILFCQRQRTTGQKFKTINLVALGIISIFVTLAQEQFCLGLIGFLLFYILFDHLKDFKEYSKSDIILFVILLIGSLILLLAPGNYVRMEENVDYMNLTLISRILASFVNILAIFFCREMFWYNLALGLIMSAAAFTLRRKNLKFLLLFAVNVVLTLCLFPHKYLGFDANVTNFIFILYRTLFLASLLVTLIFYFDKEKISSASALLFSGGGSVLCLIMSPSILHRSYFTYLFVVFIVVAICCDILFEQVKTKIPFKVGFALIVLLFGLRSAIGTYEITTGYYRNDFYNRYNHTICSQYNDLPDDQKTGEITLLVLETGYRGVMPYDNNFGMINDWMKEYYDIDEDVTIVWKTVQQLVDGE